MNTAEINIDRARRGLLPIRLPLPSHQCAICEITNAWWQTILQVAAEEPAVPQVAAEQLLLPNSECACSVCVNNRQCVHDQLVGGCAGDDISADLCGQFTIPALNGSVYAIETTLALLAIYMLRGCTASLLCW